MPWSGYPFRPTNVQSTYSVVMGYHVFKRYLCNVVLLEIVVERQKKLTVIVNVFRTGTGRGLRTWVKGLGRLGHPSKPGAKRSQKEGCASYDAFWNPKCLRFVCSKTASLQLFSDACFPQLDKVPALSCSEGGIL